MFLRSGHGRDWTPVLFGARWCKFFPPNNLPINLIPRQSKNILTHWALSSFNTKFFCFCYYINESFSLLKLFFHLMIWKVSAQALNGVRFQEGPSVLCRYSCEHWMRSCKQHPEATPVPEGCWSGAGNKGLAICQSRSQMAE